MLPRPMDFFCRPLSKVLANQACHPPNCYSSILDDTVGRSSEFICFEVMNHMLFESLKNFAFGVQSPSLVDSFVKAVGF